MDKQQHSTLYTGNKRITQRAVVRNKITTEAMSTVNSLPRYFSLQKKEIKTKKKTQMKHKQKNTNE